MKKHTKLDEFNRIYDKTYNNTLKYVLLHCNNIDDVKDIVQETYLDFYKYLSKKDFSKIANIDSYIIGISKNVLRRYYRKEYNVLSMYISNETNEIIEDVDFDLELEFITKENVNEVWKYIKNKDIKITKIFFAYYYLDMKISDIAIEMHLNESTVKNHIYRTIKELKQVFKKEDYKNV